MFKLIFKTYNQFDCSAIKSRYEKNQPDLIRRKLSNKEKESQRNSLSFMGLLCIYPPGPLARLHPTICVYPHHSLGF